MNRQKAAFNGSMLSTYQFDRCHHHRRRRPRSLLHPSRCCGCYQHYPRSLLAVLGHFPHPSSGVCGWRRWLLVSTRTTMLIESKRTVIRLRDSTRVRLSNCRAGSIAWDTAMDSSGAVLRCTPSPPHQSHGSISQGTGRTTRTEHCLVSLDSCSPWARRDELYASVCHRENEGFVCTDYNQFVRLSKGTFTIQDWANDYCTN